MPTAILTLGEQVTRYIDSRPCLTATGVAAKEQCLLQALLATGEDELKQLLAARWPGVKARNGGRQAVAEAILRKAKQERKARNKE